MEYYRINGVELRQPWAYVTSGILRVCVQVCYGYGYECTTGMGRVYYGYGYGCATGMGTGVLRVWVQVCYGYEYGCATGMGTGVLGERIRA